MRSLDISAKHFYMPLNYQKELLLSRPARATNPWSIDWVKSAGPEKQV